MNDNTVKETEASIPTESGVQIQESAAPQDEGLFLGDYVNIYSAKGKHTGRIYYLDEKILRLLPLGSSNRLEDFPFTDEGEFDPDIGVTEVEVTAGPRTGFAQMMGFRKGQKLDAFDKVTGSVYATYAVEEVDYDEDTIVLKDKNETEIVIPFNYIGIQEMPFDILQVHIGSPVGVVDTGLEGTDEEEEELLGEGEYLEYMVPDIVGVEVITESDRIYTEPIQKGDLIGDLVSLLENYEQKNPVYLKEIRAIVETFSSIKNLIIERNHIDEPIGKKDYVLQQISDLLVHSSQMVKPILDSKRVLMEDDAKFEYDANDKEDESTLTHQNIFFLKRLEEFIKQYDNIVVGENTGILRYLRYYQNLFSQFPLGQKFSQTTSTDAYVFRRDGEYFRMDVPPNEVVGYKKYLPPRKDNPRNPEYPQLEQYKGSVSMSILRGLKSTPYTKGIQFLGPDKSYAKGFVLFPIFLSKYIGSVRSGTLLEDINRSLAESHPIRVLLQLYGGVQTPAPGESPNVKQILHMERDNPSAMSISFDDYLKSMLKILYPRGFGDFNMILQDFGIEEFELNHSQQTLFQNRINEVIQMYRQLIQKLRAPDVFEFPIRDTDPIYYQSLMDKIATYDILKDEHEIFQQKSSGYDGVDIAVFGYLLSKYQEYFLGVLSGVEENIQSGFHQIMRRRAIQASTEKYLEIEAQKLKGIKPTINSCPHVKDLELIRREKDEKTRYLLLGTFAVKWKGGIQDNWLICRTCQQHLICNHEFLQIQQFIHPNEYESLQKLIVLNYAGGLYGAQYSCKNCDVPISLLTYDNHIEFDDEGRPMSGRSELIDEDALQMDLVEQLLNIPAYAPEELKFENDEKDFIYSILKQLTVRIGISMKDDIVSLVNEIYGDYLKSSNILDAEFEEKRAKTNGRDETNDDEDSTELTVAKLQNILILILASLYIQIQTKIPSYHIYIPNKECGSDFGGFFLEIDKSPMESEGVKTMACIFSSLDFTSRDSLLSSTLWASEKNEKRVEIIMQELSRELMKRVQESIVLSAYNKKREYLKKQTEYEESLRHEMIPTGFLPLMKFDKTDGAQEHIPESKVGNFLKSQSYIYMYNEIVKQHAKVNPLSPYAETSCCVTPIMKPQDFMEGKMDSLMKYLPSQKLASYAYENQSWLNVDFVPRSNVKLETEAPTNLSFQMFLKLCYKGARRGLPHELNHKLRCEWCGLQIPYEYFFPDMGLDKDNKPIVVPVKDEVFIQSFEQQNVDVGEAAFLQLLDDAHEKTSFKGEETHFTESLDSVMESLSNLQVAIADTTTDFTKSWKQTIQTMYNDLKTLPKNAQETEYLGVIADFSSIGSKAKDMLEKKRVAVDVIEYILQQDISNTFEIIRSYFLIPMMRLLTKTTTKYMKIPRYYNLSSNHETDVNQILAQHLQNNINIDITDTTIKTQIESCVQYYSVVCKHYQHLKSLDFNAKTRKLIPYFKSAFVYFPLKVLLHTSSTKNMDNVVKYVNEQLRKFSREKLGYSTQEIKERVTKATEKEKNNIIKEFERLTPQEKTLALLQKQLRMGRWAQGASDAIYTYNKDYYDAQRELRLQEMETGNMNAAEDHYEAEAGYDVGMTGMAEGEDE